MAERACDECKEQTPIKHLGTIRGRRLCKKCRSKIRQNHRKETKQQASEEEREKIRELSIKQKAEYQKAYYKKNKKENQSKEDPVIKGSTSEKRKDKVKSNSYFPFEERKLFLGMLVRRGVDFEEAKQRIKNIVDKQTEVREELISKNKSEKEIKVKQKEMLEELWKY